MKKSSLSIIFIALTFLYGYSQVSLGFVNVSLPNPNIALNDTVKIDATIFNYGNQPYNDSLKFGLLHNGVNIASPAIFPRPYPGPPVVHMNPGDSIRLNFIIVANQGEFIVGPTGVVIWPIITNQNFITHDSINKQFNIVPATGVYELQNDASNLVQSVLLNGLLHITSVSSPYAIKEVNLYSLDGRLLFKTNEALPITIPVENYATGIALLSVRLSDGRQISRKIFIVRGK